MATKWPMVSKVMDRRGGAYKSDDGMHRLRHDKPTKWISIASFPCPTTCDTERYKLTTIKDDDETSSHR